MAVKLAKRSLHNLTVSQTTSTSISPHLPGPESDLLVLVLVPVIVFHIFMPESRQYYTSRPLRSIGSSYYLGRIEKSVHVTKSIYYLGSLPSTSIPFLNLTLPYIFLTFTLPFTFFDSHSYSRFLPVPDTPARLGDVHTPPYSASALS